MFDDEKEEKKEEIQNPEEETPEFSKVALGIVIALVVLGGIVYAGYQYSQNQAKKVTYPNGYQNPEGGKNTPGNIDCQNRSPDISFWDWYNKCDQIKADANAGLETITDEKLGYEIKVPGNIKLQKYENGMGIIYKDVTPNLNLLFNIELASKRTGEFKNLKGQEYVENYWKQYPGLLGIHSLEPIVNSQGYKGYKAFYFVMPNTKGNTEIFFELGDNTGDFIHFSKGILSDDTFNIIIGSFQSLKSKPESAAPSPSEKAVSPAPAAEGKAQ